MFSLQKTLCGLGLMLMAGTQVLAASAEGLSAPQYRAQIKAIHQAVISSEVQGRIDAVKVHDGDRFKAGEVLLTYDCSGAKAQLRRAQAAEAAASNRWKNASELKKLNSISQGDFADARAGVQVAQAESQIERLKVDKCSFTAPFGGIVGEVFVKPHEFVGEGSKLFTLFDDSGFEVETILPSAMLRTLKVGSLLTLEVDETGSIESVEVTHIAGNIDPVSQSVKVTGKILRSVNPQGGKAEGAPLPLLPGMSGTIRTH